VGLMGIIADAVLRAGGEATGVIPENLMAREVGHKGLTRLHVVHSMHERRRSWPTCRMRSSPCRADLGR
jgi:predicted Rossmann-fold nucleotide-binding protein